MSELLDDMIALEDAARHCIPRMAADAVVHKYEFKTESVTLLDVEYHSATGQKVVVLESCGTMSYYIAQLLRELLAEDGIDAWVTFNF
jgi:hypothetical protein